jgi:hypothetical protein
LPGQKANPVKQPIIEKESKKGVIMLVNQIAVFLENSKGKISDLCKILSTSGINIISMSIADSNDYGILRAITNDNILAVKVLKEAGFTVARSDLLGVEVEDKPGTLELVLAELDENDINIEYLYSYTTKVGTALIIVKVKDVDFATKVLQKKGIKVQSDVFFN